MKTIKSDPELKVRLKEILTRAKELMLHDDINEYLERLDEEEGREEQEREAYQRELFEAYVLRRTDHEPERRELMRMYRDGHPLTGPRGLRKRLAAIDLGYFGGPI